MSDLIERLRDYPNNQGHMGMRETAADALEESQAQIDSLQQKVHLCAAYDKMEKCIAELEAALQKIYKDGVWNECEYCARKVVIANDALQSAEDNSN